MPHLLILGGRQDSDSYLYGPEWNDGPKNKLDGAKVSAHVLLYFVDFTAMSH